MTECGAYRITHRETLSEGFLDRLILFYNRQPEPVLSDIWEGITKRFYRPLQEALISGSKPDLVRFFDYLYAGDTVFGIDLGQKAPNYHRSLFEHVAFAAQALGVSAVPNPAQPVHVPPNPLGLLCSIEQVIGFRVTHSGGCGMGAVEIDGRTIPWKLVEALCPYASIRRLIGGGGTILEIGAGAGFLGYLCSQTRLIYQSVDLPLVSVIQGYLLATALGEDSIWFSGEARKTFEKVLIYGLDLEEVEDVDVAVNQDSLPELTGPTRSGLLWLLRERIVPRGFFLSINHESPLGGQVRVFDDMAKLRGFRPLYRCPYWCRPGYVEEAWVRAD